MDYRGYRLPDFQHFDSDHFDNVELPIINECVEHFRAGNRLVMLQAPTGCLSGETELVVNRGGNARRHLLKDLVPRFNGNVFSYPAPKGGFFSRSWDTSIPTRIQTNIDGFVRLHRLRAAFSSGMKKTYRIKVRGNPAIRATGEHPFFTPNGWTLVDDLSPGQEVFINVGQSRKGEGPKKHYFWKSNLRHHPYATHKRETSRNDGWRVPFHRLVAEAALNNVDVEKFTERCRKGDVRGLMFISTVTHAVHHVDGNQQNNSPDNLQVLTHREHNRLEGLNKTWRNVAYRVEPRKILSIEEFGVEETYDLQMDGEPHNFLANGFVVHNCGKTIIGECVRQRLDVTGTYACSTLTLQQQFIRDYGGWAHKIQGRRNYLPLDTDAGVGKWQPTCGDCDYDHASKLCTFCSPVDACPYTVAKLAAADADLCNGNYAYLLNEWKGGDRSLFTKRGLLIADEADGVEDELLRHITVTISPRYQKLLHLSAPRYKTKEDSWQEWLDYAIPHIYSRLAQLPNSTLPDKRLRKAIGNLHTRLTEISGNLDGWLYTYEQGAISFKPVTVNHLANESFWQHTDKCLAMSATIISPVEWVTSLGYEDSWQFVEAPSVFPAENRPIYFYPAARMVGKPEDQKRNAWPDMGVAVLTVLERYPDKRVLIHVNSYGLAGWLYHYLRESWARFNTPRPLFCYMDAAERQDAIDAYEQTPGAVLLASSLERGYDGAGEKCSAQIICKTMYASLGDKQVSTRLYGTPNGSLWYDVCTTRSMVQATGRAVRGPEEQADSWILDTQFAAFFNKRQDMFPGYWKEALHMDGSHRFHLRAEIREVKTRLNKLQLVR